MLTLDLSVRSCGIYLNFRKCSGYQSIKCIWMVHTKKFNHISHGPMSQGESLLPGMITNFRFKFACDETKLPSLIHFFFISKYLYSDSVLVHIVLRWFGMLFIGKKGWSFFGLKQLTCTFDWWSNWPDWPTPIVKLEPGYPWGSKDSKLLSI